MTDPLALTIAFSRNLETKIIKIPRIYSKYYLIKIRFSKLKILCFLDNPFFQNNSKIIFLNKGQNTDDGS